MKYLSIFIILSYINCSGQTFVQLRDSANKYEKLKDSAKAFAFLTRRINLSPNHPYHNELYEAAGLASSLGEFDSAYKFINHLLAEREFDMLTCDANADPSFSNLRSQASWGQMLENIYQRKIDIELKLRSAVSLTQKSFDDLRSFSDSVLVTKLFHVLKGPELYRMLRNYNEFPLLKSNSLIFPVKLNDTLVSFYSVWIPKNYKSDKATSLMFVLHGAVYQNLGFPDPLEIKEHAYNDTAEMNRYFYQVAVQTNSIVVFPHANKDFNWMAPKDGFSMIPSILSDLKRIFNIDDDRIYLFGHSNGATGVTSYLLKNPTDFAGFYGFNSKPTVHTGGTFLKNAMNRSYINISTDKDYYFPVSAHKDLAQMADSLGLDWRNFTYKGFPHWFPMFPESKSAFSKTSEDMSNRERKSFRNRIYWQCDDIDNGSCDWISIKALDTANTSNTPKYLATFTATHWVNNRDTSQTSDTVLHPFHFPRKSGLVEASYGKNTFVLNANGVQEIGLLISPEMVDLRKPVIVIVNGKKVYDKIVTYNSSYLIERFRSKFDRKAIWVNEIIVKVPSTNS